MFLAFNMNGTQHRLVWLLFTVGFTTAQVRSTFASRSSACEPTQCKGPIKYYKELKCKPIFARDDDCCAVRYDCSHLSALTKDKCHVNGREYAVGEDLNDEDRSNPCEIGCVCTMDMGGVAVFICPVLHCDVNMKVSPGCYVKRNPNGCCQGEEICPIFEEEKVKCTVDGKTYMAGEYFYPKSNPDVICQCLEGFRGNLVKPFCTKMKCGTELRGALERSQKCAPIFDSHLPPTIGCSTAYRCQTSKDAMIPNTFSQTNTQVTDEMTCKFGNMTMNIGDELNQGTNPTSVCVKCVCEVPPTPTCQRLSECSV